MCIKTLFLYQRPQGNMGAHALICHAIYIHRLLSLLFKGSRLQSSYLCSELGDRMMKLQQWACTARGAHKCEKCLFAFSARQPFSCFLESIWPQGFTKLASSNQTYVSGLIAICLNSVWWMRVHIDSPLSSISAFQKEFKFHTVDFGTSEQMKPLQHYDQAAEFKFEFKFEPLSLIWQLLPNSVPEDNRRFWLQNQCHDCRALGAALLHSLGGSDDRVNTGRFRVGGSRCGPRPAEVRLAWGKYPTTLAILTQFKSQQRFNDL